jgi:hypothetical protein
MELVNNSFIMPLIILLLQNHAQKNTALTPLPMANAVVIITFKNHDATATGTLVY